MGIYKGRKKGTINESIRMAQAQLPQWTVGSMTYRELSLALSNGEAAVHWCQRHKLLSGTSCCLTARCALSVEQTCVLVRERALTLRIWVGDAPERDVERRWPCDQGRFLRAATYLFHKSSP